MAHHRELSVAVMSVANSVTATVHARENYFNGPVSFFSYFSETFSCALVHLKMTPLKKHFHERDGEEAEEEKKGKTTKPSGLLRTS